MPNPNDELIQRFYAAFDRKDGDAMAACYTPDARFDDPVFPGLTGKQPGDMWRVLTSRATDLKIELREHEADDTTGSAHWIATYTFSQTGRKVVNDVALRTGVPPTVREISAARDLPRSTVQGSCRC